MKKSRHAPRPWILGGFIGETSRTIYCKNKIKVIANLHDVSHADAVLMAAAPELLEALEKCLSILSGETLCKKALEDAISSSVAVLKKAKGE